MASVGCAGILVADVFCGPMRELPRAGELLVLDAMPSSVGGCAANVAIDLAKQGIGVEVAGAVGDDADAEVVLGGLLAHGIGCDRIVRVPGLPTSKTVILLIQGEDRRYIHVLGANAGFTVGHVDREWLAGLDVFYLGGLFLMPSFCTDALAELLQSCRRQGVRTAVDVVIPKGAHVSDAVRRLLPHVDCFMPNEDEAVRLTGCVRPVDQVSALCDMGVGLAIVTRGELGAVAGRADDVWEAGRYTVDAVDPSGAGDAFAAGVITGLLSDWSTPEILKFGSALGASATRAVGTTAGVFSADEARAFMEAHPLALRSL